MKLNQILILILTLTATLASKAQTGDVKNFGTFRTVCTPQGYDSILSEIRTSYSVEAYDRFYNEFINIDTETIAVNDDDNELYEKRLKMMATEIQLPFNKVVKAYITVYLRKQFMEGILGRAQYFFPIFEEALYRHNLPMELKMLPVIESALVPRAKSIAAAVGLWQFMPATGKYYGLEINSFVDERSDPIKSTEAACRFLKDLYKMYGDWTLVIAAYNCGPGTVSKALQRVPNATTYWDIYNYLPQETRGYMPAFIAASYAYTYHKAHGLVPATPEHPLATDTVMVDQMIHFDQIATTLNIPTEILRTLNPQYRIDIVPAKGIKYPLTLPQASVTEFMDRRAEINAKDTLYLAKYLNVSNLNEAARLTENRKVASSISTGKSTGKGVTYKVKKGDTLGAIANRYGVKVNELQSWNGIRGANIQIGQNIVIYRK